RDGVILFAPSATQELYRIRDIGGDRSAVTSLKAPQEIGHLHPVFLADGRHFLFTIRGVPDVQGVYVGSLDGGEPHRLLPGAVAPNIAGDYVLFVRQGTTFAQPFRQSPLGLNGDPVAIAEGVIADRGYAAAALSATGTNTLAYRMGREGERQLVWFDRSGKELERLGNPEPASVGERDLELSHDGRRLALARINNGNRDIWVLDLIRGGTNRITSDPAMSAQPVWSPDDRRIAFVSSRTGV